MKTDPSGRDPDAAITARAREVAKKVATEGFTPFEHRTREIEIVTPLIAAALCAVRDETREECAREVETVSVLTPTMRQSIAKALRAGVGGAG